MGITRRLLLASCLAAAGGSAAGCSPTPAASVTGSASVDVSGSPATRATGGSFPPGFAWGVATSAFQEQLSSFPGVIAVAEPTSMTWLGLHVALQRAGCDLSLVGTRHAARLRGAISGKRKSDVIAADVLRWPRMSSSCPRWIRPMRHSSAW